MITLEIHLGFSYPRSIGGEYQGCFLGATDKFLLNNNVQTLTASARKFKGCSVAKLDAATVDYGLVGYNTVEDVSQPVDLCGRELRRLFGRVPKTIYYKIN